MGGKKLTQVTLDALIEKSIDERVKEEVGRRWNTVLKDTGKGSTTAAQDTAICLKYYATAKCMMLRAEKELEELHSYMASVDAMIKYERNKTKLTKLYKAKKERYDGLEADVYRLKRWISDIDFAIDKLKDPEHKRWIVGRYVLEKTDAEIASGIAGVSGREEAVGWTSDAVKDAINVLKYYLFPMKALREDVIGVRNRTALYQSDIKR